MPITSLDDSVRAWMLLHRNTGASSFFSAVSAVGAPNPMIGFAVLAVLLLWWKGRPFAAGSLLIAPACILATSNIAKNIFVRARPAGQFVLEPGNSFPSAHSAASAAVCCAVAWVLWQERMISGALAIALATIIPLLVGVSRLYLDVHWTTDVLAGWGYGLCVAALSVALSRATRRARA